MPSCVLPARCVDAACKQSQSCWATYLMATSCTVMAVCPFRALVLSWSLAKAGAWHVCQACHVVLPLAFFAQLDMWRGSGDAEDASRRNSLQVNAAAAAAMAAVYAPPSHALPVPHLPPARSPSLRALGEARRVSGRPNGTEAAWQDADTLGSPNSARSGSGGGSEPLGAFVLPSPGKAWPLACCVTVFRAHLPCAQRLACLLALLVLP